MPLLQRVSTRRGRLALGLFAGLGLLAFAAADPARQDLASQVRGLVAQLDNKELAVRERAERQLIELGPAALVFLPAVTERTPAETAQRLSHVRQALEAARAARAAEASLVTLKGEFRVGELLKEISRQTGNVLVDRRGGDAAQRADDEPTLAVDFQDQPFWQALDEVLDRADLDVDSYARAAGLAIVPRAAGRLPRAGRASYAGPFRAEAARLEEVADLRRPENRSLKLLVEVDWEPRLRPILVSQPLGGVKATAGGAPLAIDGRGDVSAPVGDGPSAMSFEIPLATPPRSVAKIDAVEGQLKLLLPTDVEVFRFPFLSAQAVQQRKAQQHKGAVTVTLEEMRRSGDAWEVEVSARFDDPNLAIDSYLIGWLLDNKVTLTHEGRPPLVPISLVQTRQTPKEVGVKYRFTVPGSLDGWSLDYASPTAVLEVPAQYRLINLDLP